MIMRHPEGEDERHQQVFDEEAPVSQQAEEAALKSAQCWFDSSQEHQFTLVVQLAEAAGSNPA